MPFAVLLAALAEVPDPRRFDHLTDHKAVHVFSAFASDAAPVLAHQELAGAPDEVAAVPKPMAELGLTGVLSTADALHCRKERIRAGGGDQQCPAGPRQGQPAHPARGPGCIRSVALDVLRTNGVQNISQALCNNALSPETLLAPGMA